MAPNSLFPAAIVIDYHSIYAPHKMTLPVREFSAPSGGHPAGTLLAWDATQCDVLDMLTAFTDVLMPFFPTTTVFEGFTLYTYDNPTAPARPKAQGAFTALVGESGAGTPAEQTTFNFKTTNFGAFKLVLLDCIPSTGFIPVSSFPSPAYDNMIALADVILANEWAFQGRDGYQVADLRRVTYDLNDKLRESYRLT